MPMLGFGGSVAAMIASLKNNARERKSIYDNRPSVNSLNGKTPAQFKKASPEYLAELRAQLKAERKDRAKKQVLAAILVAMLGLRALATLYIYRFQIIDADFAQMLS